MKPETLVEIATDPVAKLPWIERKRDLAFAELREKWDALVDLRYERSRNDRHGAAEERFRLAQGRARHWIAAVRLAEGLVETNGATRLEILRDDEALEKLFAAYSQGVSDAEVSYR